VAFNSREYLRAYYADHREKAVAYARAYRITHRAEIKERRAADRAAHPEREHDRNVANYAKHRDARTAGSRAYYAMHREQAAQRMKAYAPKWRAANAAKWSGYMNVRRARKAAAGGSHTPQEWLEKLELFAHCCAYCGESRPLTRDHKIPLTRGGTDDIMNILPVCRPCNSRKGMRTAQEYLALRVA
jgi:5-methylcytosine-specific restriction endonuclease McrA